jgi:hypothetical protein
MTKSEKRKTKEERRLSAFGGKSEFELYFFRKAEQVRLHLNNLALSDLPAEA